MTAFQGDIGFEVILETGTDLTLASLVQIAYKSPSGVKGLWSAATRNGTQIVATSQISTFNEAGRWTLQAKVTLPVGVFHGEPTTMVVSPILS